jgi:hypothetical protein
MNEKSKKNNPKIQKIEITKDNLTGRSGEIFFVKYLEQIQIFDLFIFFFKILKKSRKGSDIKNIFKQIILYFIDGTYKKISGFNNLKNDKGYAATIETLQEDMCSSSTIKRFFEKFTFNLNWLFEKILIELFIWRLNRQSPKVIELFIDTMVLENNSSPKREGVKWTYKKTNGYQPFNIIWEGLLINTILKAGNRHSLSENTAEEKIMKLVKIIRKRYLKDIPIVIKMDGGFLDEKLFDKLEKLNVYFICVAR